MLTSPSKIDINEKYFGQFFGNTDVEKRAVHKSHAAIRAMVFKLIVATGTLVGVLAWVPIAAHAEESAVLLPPAKDSGAKVGSPNLPPPEPEFSLPEGLRALKRISYKIQAGDTLGNLFIRYGLSLADRKLWLQAIQKHLPLSAFRPGKEVQLYLSRALSANQKAKEQLKALEVEQNEDSILTWEKGTKGIVFSKREKPYDVELKTAGGIVERTLFEDGARVGLSSTILSQLADIFSWELDFDKEIQKGDTFKVLYEERSRQGSKNRPALKILAAELVNAGRRYFAMYFEKEKGKGDYYDLNGRTLARAFLRFPLEFTNISSGFADSRIHPILKIDVPHHGVDFAAGRGTPVRSVADGKILFAGWRKGGYGRLIEIEHDPTYSSRYAHLQSVAKGIRNGSTVQKGQVIGYVGSSGLSTGPHLHFEIYQNNAYVDPLNFESPAEDQIEPALLKVFENRKQLFTVELAATPAS
jgi:murein DD-endopeptidase MepM/ murein hydrolase activator NlpD